MNQKISCANCGTELKNVVTSGWETCSNCGISQEVRIDKPHIKFPKKYYLYLLPILIIILYFLINSILIYISPNFAMTKMSESELLAYRATCLKHKEKSQDCMINVYKNLFQKDPNSTVYAANLAMNLTKNKQYDEAESNYKLVLNKGTGAYDLMAYYAMNFDGQNNLPEAIKWYEKALSLYPNLVDITQKLASDYVKSNRIFEAISLLKSFSIQYPNSEGYLAGDISAMIELIDKDTTQQNEQTRLVSLNKGQFEIPLKLSSTSSPIIFLIDTGASIVTMPTKDALINFPNEIRNAKIMNAKLADGRIIQAHIFIAPEIQMGQWKFHNVHVSYCDTCSRLAGMSLLKDLTMEIGNKGSFFTLTLKR